MKKREEEQNVIQITKETPAKKNSVWEKIVSFFFGLLFTAQLCAPLAAAAPVSKDAFGGASAVVGILTAALVVLLFLVLFQFVIERKKLPLWAFACGGILLFALAAFLLRTLFMNGASVYANAALSNWNSKTGSVVYYFAVNPKMATAGLCFFMGLSAYGIAAITELLVFYQRKIELLLVNFIFFAASWLLLPSAPVWPGILAGIGMLFFIVYIGAERGFFTGKKSYYVLPAVVLVISAALILLLTFVVPDQVMSRWQNGLISAVEDLRFGKTDLTDGDLKKTGWRNTSHETRLDVALAPVGEDAGEEPEEALKDHKAYLRGFVGAQYTGSKWTDLNEEAYQDTGKSENLSMFQWLSEENPDGDPRFLPISSLPETLGLLNTYDGSTYRYPTRQYSYQIRNAGASGKYLYMPADFTAAYTVDEEGRKALEPDQMNRDLNLKNNLFQKSDIYAADTVEMPVDDYVELLDNGALENEAFSAAHAGFIQREQNYSSFVDQCYNYRSSTDSDRTYYDRQTLTDAAVSYFNEQEELDRTNAGGAYEIIWTIREYLEKNLTYSDMPESTFGTGKASSPDYVVNLLQTDREGFSVQFATAATLLFRYYGIPARYVEGYMVKGDAKTAYASNAHAWVEIYRYGFGWVTVDVTPGYYDVPEERQLLQRQKKDHEGGEQEDTEDPDLPGNGQDEPSSSGSSSRNLLWLWILLAILGILAIIFFRNFIAMRLRDRKMHGEDPNENIRVMSTYILKNAKKGGVDLRHDFAKKEAGKMNSFIGAQTGVRYEEASEALAHAMYSREGANEEDARIMENYLKASEEALMGPAGFLRKLKLRYIDLVC